MGYMYADVCRWPENGLLPLFHGENTGSIPVGRASKIKHLAVNELGATVFVVTFVASFRRSLAPSGALCVV